ncbi:MAG: TonB-dependent receptor [Maricaulaceae bacterium]|jgi:outer membrane receptor protein involved in Fe transport
MFKECAAALSSVLFAALGAPAIFPTLSSALAQDDLRPDGEDANASQGVISFTPEDFAAARPNTALDMINRMPGFSFDGGDNVRGFAGAAGNVLIDGRRPATKSENLSSTLERIPIDQVERIDIIRGGAPGIDMQGQTVIANVIRHQVDTFQQIISLRGIIFAETGHPLYGGSYQATRRVGEHQFDFELRREIRYDDSIGFGTRTTLDAALNDILIEDAFNEADGTAHNARANYQGPLAGGQFNINGLIGADEFKNESHYFSTDTDEVFVNRGANDRGEIGFNFSRPLTSRFEIEFIGLSKIAFGEGRNTGETDTSSSLLEVEAEAGETIGRTELSFAPSDTLTFEGGGEIAYNYREQQVALTVDGAAIALPASDVLVEELRGEAFAQASWRPSDRYSFEAGVRVEESTITQSGDTDLERSFVYPKPRLVATWSPTDGTQLRFRAEREVGQLNFSDFASSVNLSTDVLNAGNSQLEPDKTWAYELELERRFWDDGAVVLTLRHEDITDVVDRFPFFVFVDDNNDGVPDDADMNGEPDQILVSGPGNIGDGTNDVIELNLALPLDRVGLEGGEFRFDALFRDSEVTDPLTGETRRISGQRPNNISASYRQDLPARDLTFGVNYFAGWSERRYQLEQVLALDLRNYWATFVEYKPTDRLTLRAGLNNLAPYSFTIERSRFDGPRDTGALLFVETEERDSQIIGELRARFTFD